MQLALLYFYLPDPAHCIWRVQPSGFCRGTERIVLQELPTVLETGRSHCPPSTNWSPSEAAGYLPVQRRRGGGRKGHVPPSSGFALFGPQLTGEAYPHRGCLRHSVCGSGCWYPLDTLRHAQSPFSSRVASWSPVNGYIKLAIPQNFPNDI